VKRPILAILTIALLLLACDKLEDPTSVKMDDIVKLELTGPATVRADGVSTTSFKATIPREATSRTVKFATTRGSFQGTDGKAELSVMTDENGVANAILIAGRDVVVANVTVTAGAFVASVQLPHERALPTAMTAETSSAAPTTNGSRNATITAILTRSTGFVSIGTPATFEAFAVATNGTRTRAGRFLNIGTSDASGKVSATFSADTPDTPAGTNVVIVVTVQSEAGPPLSAEVSLRAVSP
jgi:hypothetical protein